MIFGIGIDIVEIERIRKEFSEERGGVNPALFTGNELDYCNSKRYPEIHLAGRLAAKEAFFKATGKGLELQSEWQEVEVLNSTGGTPDLLVSGTNRDRLALIGVTKIHLSLSHSESSAVAVVILAK